MEFEIRTDLPARIKRKGKYAVVSEPREADVSPNVATLESVKATGEKQTSANAPLIEVEVLRIPPNPRLVICRYRVCGEEQRCMVNVGRNSKFVPRMKFWIPEPGDPTTRVKPWAYTGRLPKRRGRW